MTTEAPPRGDRRRVRQMADRGRYDPDTVHAILDACRVGHVAFVVDGQPFSIPTAIARIDDWLYLHGSRSSRLFQLLAGGAPVAVSVCLLDGLVKARSAFHCSMNYRSVVVFGRAEQVPEAERADLLFRFTERLIPLPRTHYRDHLAKELKATMLVRLPLDEASAKLRTGGPIDDEEDLTLPHWAGVIPLSEVMGEPEPAADLAPGIAVPAAFRE
jgi:nitroimidazol reductase NimA-like FMN-containing flavoprotein (pyridoxamine 5'-phosphate oxidase superfamily)